MNLVRKIHLCFLVKHKPLRYARHRPLIRRTPPVYSLHFLRGGAHGSSIFLRQWLGRTFDDGVDHLSVIEFALRKATDEGKTAVNQPTGRAAVSCREQRGAVDCSVIRGLGDEDVRVSEIDDPGVTVVRGYELEKDEVQE